ncbi:MAG: transcription-repair coupling factor [Tepidanaerobacteraceae bacterium]|jgi:transcription-repair coupling factor (superfamily II helicase)|nr:transcription-repair coupling factor [Tepidanaerobacteraceae bacterium]
MFSITDICGEIPEFNRLIGDMEKGFSNLFAYGVSDSQRAFLIALLKSRIKSQALVITSDSLEAKKLAEDLSFFLKPEEVALYPASSVIPYETAARSLESTAQRLKVMDMLLSGRPVVVVASVQALLNKLVPPDIVKKFTLYFKVGTAVSMEEVLMKLSAMGYERVEMIEGRGQFAARGGILDIYPPAAEHPYRLEFFDDIIDSIREFLPEDQRSRSKLEEAHVGPAREVIYDAHTANAAAINIARELKERREVLLALGHHKTAACLEEKVQEHVEKLQSGLFFESAELYISHLYDSCATIFDYFSRKPFAVLVEPGRIREAQKNAAFEAEETFKGLLEKGEILASQASIYFSPFEMLERLKKFRVVYMAALPKIHPEFEAGGLYSFQFRSMTPLYGKLDLLVEEITRLKKKKYRILVLSGTAERGEHMQKSLRERGIEAVSASNLEEVQPGQVAVLPGSLERGFEEPQARFVIISDMEIYGRPKKQQRPKSSARGRKIEDFQELAVGDYVVHAAHGIGKYLGVETLEVAGHKKDYFALSYAGGDKLYVPTDQVDLIQKYVGSDETPPKLNKLGSNEWSKAKNRAKEAIREMAQELIKLYAARQAMKGFAFSKDTPWQKEFEDMFPYEETPDQLTAIEEVKRDMESDRPMDRLLCGDVGYGKTEVALRAAFKAVMDAKQVAVLVPTTILAEQHYHTFTERFAPFPVKIDVISRFKSPAEQRETLKKLRSGEVDIIIGTHRLLQKDVKFKDLGLLVVDEEQRFGVSHKEKIKQMKKNVDVLTLTATPIPRTLHMAMSGVRDMSIIETPPEDRFPIQTYVVEHNESLIRDAILRELSRNGQVYYVHNRIETIHEEARRLQELVPEARIAVAHGRMDEDELEDVMLNFYDHNFDVLVCTTIIETGLDIPNVNTLIITSADKMGLSQLYQLRGRVGRSNRQAFAYLTYKKDRILSETAEKRLSAIREFTEFGSGFKIALKDLEIRGAGNILGTEQHGHMMAIGYDLYNKLLSAAIKELKGEKVEEEVQPTIDLPVSAYISDDYIKNTAQKMEIYRRIAAVETVEEVCDLEDEIEDRFGDIPEPARNLIEISRIKVLARKLKITSINQQGEIIRFQFRDAQALTPETIFRLSEVFQKQIVFTSSSVPAFSLRTRGMEGYKLLTRIEKLLDEMNTMQESCSVV